jgi:hypothetical protein
LVSGLLGEVGRFLGVFVFAQGIRSSAEGLTRGLDVGSGTGELLGVGFGGCRIARCLGQRLGGGSQLSFRLESTGGLREIRGFLRGLG